MKFFAYESTNAIDLTKAFCSPSFHHWFGCDSYGMDLAQLIVLGFKTSLVTAITVTTVSMSLGLLLGALSTHSPQPIKWFCKQLILSLLAFPGLLLAILVASFLPASQFSMIFALILTSVASSGKLFENLIQKAYVQPFIEASHAQGASNFRILSRHIWPSIAEQVKIQALVCMASSILGEASLSFLGIGASLDDPSLGRLIADGRMYLVEAPHLSLIPGFFLVLFLYIFHLLSQALRKNVDHLHKTPLY